MVVAVALALAVVVAVVAVATAVVAAVVVIVVVVVLLVVVLQCQNEGMTSRKDLLNTLDSCDVGAIPVVLENQHGVVFHVLLRRQRETRRMGLFLQHLQLYRGSNGSSLQLGTSCCGRVSAGSVLLGKFTNLLQLCRKIRLIWLSKERPCRAASALMSLGRGEMGGCCNKARSDSWEFTMPRSLMEIRTPQAWASCSTRVPNLSSLLPPENPASQAMCCEHE